MASIKERVLEQLKLGGEQSASQIAIKLGLKDEKTARGAIDALRKDHFIENDPVKATFRYVRKK